MYAGGYMDQPEQYWDTMDEMDLIFGAALFDEKAEWDMKHPTGK